MATPPTLIPLPTHTLALYPHGPIPINPSTPTILFINGVASHRLVWSAVTRRLPAPLRSYTYDRSGFGASTRSPLPPTATHIAQELSLLLSHLRRQQSNPVILVAHSWAGVIVRELLLLGARDGVEMRDMIAGVVFVDANHETTPLVLDPNDASLGAMAKGVDWRVAQGLTSEHKFTDEEWTALLKAESGEEYEAIAEAEENEYAESFPVLRGKRMEGRQPLLGDKPVYVIGGMRSRDWTGLYKAGVGLGNGTEEERRRALALIAGADEKSERLMREHLKLSTKGKLVFAKESGHFVMVTQPEIVVEGVEWVLREAEPRVGV